MRALSVTRLMHDLVVEASPLAPSTWWGTLLSAAVLLERERRDIPRAWMHSDAGPVCIARLLEHTLWPHGLVAHPVPADLKTGKPYWAALAAFTLSLGGAEPCAWEQWWQVPRLIAQLRRAAGVEVSRA